MKFHNDIPDVTPVDILLFGKMGEIGPVVRDDLIGHGFSVQLVDFPQNTFKDESGYRRTLLKAVAAFQPRIILPIGHPLAMTLAVEDAMCAVEVLPGTDVVSPEQYLRASFDALALLQNAIVPIPSVETIRLLDSKVRVSALAAKLGIPQPRLYTNADEAPEGQVVFKRDRSFGGSGVYRPKKRESLLNLMAHEPGSPYLIEDYIEGTDLSVDCVRIPDGRCLSTVGFREPAFFKAGCYRTVSKRQGQGPSVLREVVDCPQAVEYAHRLLDAVDYRGVCGLDFRLAASGRDSVTAADADDGSVTDDRLQPGNLYFLECNPRFTGGIATQIASGFDIPYELVKNIAY